MDRRKGRLHIKVLFTLNKYLIPDVHIQSYNTHPSIGCILIRQYVVTCCDSF